MKVYRLLSALLRFYNSILGGLYSVEKISNIVIKFIQFENEQSPQIGVLEELAISLVAFLVPASYPAGLITLMLASKLT
jgi:hypothetical protein